MIIQIRDLKKDSTRQMQRIMRNSVLQLSIDWIQQAYICFGSEAEKASFLHDWGIAVSELMQKAGDKYVIIDEIEQCI